MRLLVSVRDVYEAVDALAGGADVIDVKEPLRGALGVADTAIAHAIARRVGARRPVSIVIGDVVDELTAVQSVQCARRSGASIVKIGLAGVDSIVRGRRLIHAVASSAMPAATAVVAYGDAHRARSLTAEQVLELAVREQVEGLVLDTFDKNGPSLLSHVTHCRLARLISDAHAAGLFVGIAGKLGRQHVSEMSALHVDLFGVRGAVCTAERTAQLSRARVRALALLLREHDGAQHAAQSA